MPIKSVLFFTDPHIPLHDPKLFKGLFQYLKANPQDEIICGGDLMDFSQISHHNSRNLKALTDTTILEDYQTANRLLDQLQFSSPHSKIVLIEGNHDERILRYIEEHPQTEGLLEIPKALSLKDRGIEWVPFWSKGSIYSVGHANFIHGLYVNELHSKKHLLAYQNNIFYGHTHDIQCYSLVTHGEGKTRVGQSCGCTCLYDQNYTQGNPTKWQQAFVQFYFYPNGNFQYYVVRVFNGKFIGPDGQEYGGRN